MNDFAEVVNFAIEREVEARKFYLDIAANSQQDLVKKMFLEFAEEEKKHEKILKEVLNNKEEQLHFAKSDDYGIAETVEFPAVSTEMPLADIFALAMKNEEQAVLMYQKMAADASSPQMRELFENLANMEQGHKYLLEEAYTDVAYGEVW